MAEQGDRMPVIILSALPVLATQISWGFLRYQARRKRGVRVFREELLRGGMPSERAEQLAQAYHEVGSIRLLAKNR